MGLQKREIPRGKHTDKKHIITKKNESVLMMSRNVFTLRHVFASVLSAIRTKKGSEADNMTKKATRIRIITWLVRVPGSYEYECKNRYLVPGT